MSICLSSDQPCGKQNDKMSTLQVLSFYGFRIVNAILNEWHKLLGFHKIAFDTIIYG